MKRVLIEEEQRARVRAAALKKEAELELRESEPGVGTELLEIRNVLSRVGRKSTYGEELMIELHKERLATASAEQKAKEKRA
jgi:hypothetical protein